MPTSPITGSSSTDPTTQSTTSSGSTTKNQGTLDKEAFLKLLVAQLSHQDPLKPMEGTEFVTQLAQFTSVEQQIMQSQKLDILSTQMQGLAGNEAAMLVGKRVTVQGQGNLNFDGSLAATGSFSLQGNATSVKVDIKDKDGNVVRTMDMKSRNAGAVGVTWDGKNDSGKTMPPGQYSVEVHATDKDGKPVATTQQVSGIVTAVTYDKGYPEVVLDNGVHAPLSELVSVGGSATGTTGNTGSGATANLPASAAASQTLNQQTLQSISQMLSQMASSSSQP